MSKSDSVSQANYQLKDGTLELLSELAAGSEYSGVIQKETFDRIVSDEGETVSQVLLGLLPLAASRAFASISNYSVGAVCLGASGNIYFGSNIEIPGQALSSAVHAEQSAFANAFSHGERQFKATALTAAPCGHCRQFLTEFSFDMDLVLIVKGEEETTLRELLPHPFGPRHLGFTSGVSDHPPTELKLPSSSQLGLAEIALWAAERSYSPYSNSPSGAALLTKSGRIFSGSYLENAGFNPSLPPLQAALVSLMQSGEHPESIKDCVIVELQGAKITQEDSARAVLKALQPEARLEMIYAQHDQHS